MNHQVSKLWKLTVKTLTWQFAPPPGCTHPDRSARWASTCYTYVFNRIWSPQQPSLKITINGWFLNPNARGPFFWLADMISFARNQSKPDLSVPWSRCSSWDICKSPVRPGFVASVFWAGQGRRSTGNKLFGWEQTRKHSHPVQWSTSNQSLGFPSDFQKWVLPIFSGHHHRCLKFWMRKFIM